MSLIIDDDWIIDADADEENGHDAVELFFTTALTSEANFWLQAHALTNTLICFIIFDLFHNFCASS